MSSEKVLVIAGEASGDLHAAGLVGELRALCPALRVYAVGGERLKAAGAEIILPSAELSVVGLFEVFSHLGPITKAYMKVRRWLSVNRPAALVLIDFPEFNLLMARHAKRVGIPVFYYISPQIWAWRRGRVRKIKRLVDRMAVILPFEQEFYRRYGMDVEFVGHPLLDSVKATMPRGPFMEQHGINAGSRLVCLLPGSRQGEIARHLDMLTEAASMIRAGMQQPVAFCLPLAPGLPDRLKDTMAKRSGHAAVDIKVIDNDTYNALAASDLALAASGTVTLEAAILGTPMIVTYRVSPVSYRLGRRLIKVKWVSLVNLIANREVVPELLQDAATPENIARTALGLLRDREAMDRMKQEIGEATALLGQPGAARRAAALLCGMIKS